MTSVKLPYCFTGLCWYSERTVLDWASGLVGKATSHVTLDTPTVAGAPWRSCGTELSGRVAYSQAIHHAFEWAVEIAVGQ